MMRLACKLANSRYIGAIGLTVLINAEKGERGVLDEEIKKCGSIIVVVVNFLKNWAIDLERPLLEIFSLKLRLET